MQWEYKRRLGRKTRPEPPKSEQFKKGYTFPRGKISSVSCGGQGCGRGCVQKLLAMGAVAVWLPVGVRIAHQMHLKDQPHYSIPSGLLLRGCVLVTPLAVMVNWPHGVQCLDLSLNYLYVQTCGLVFCPAHDLHSGYSPRDTPHPMAGQGGYRHAGSQSGA